MVSVAVLAIGCLAAQPSAAQDYWPGETWRTSAPEAQGIDAAVLGRIDEYVKKSFPYMSSVLIVRGGFIVFEKYYQGGQDDPRSQYSVTKSLMSALTGIVIGQGSIESPQSEAYRYMPDALRAAMGPAAKTITVRHLLTHTSGLGDTMGAGEIEPALLAASLGSGLRSAPGTEFAYNGNNPNLLSAMITHVSGLRASELARKYLFDRIGVTRVGWEEGSRWTAGYTGASLATRDMARLGYLFLRQGRWNGEQVVPKEWVAESTRRQVPIPFHYQTPGIDDAHGYGWWTMQYDGHAAFAAIGYAGQRICVIPDLDLVIVFTGTGGGFDVEHLPIIRDCIVASIRR